MLRRERLQEQERRPHVHRHVRVQLGRRQLLERLIDRASMVRHDDVEPPELGAAAHDHTSGRLRVGEIRLDVRDRRPERAQLN